jgi:hypothetical protein
VNTHTGVSARVLLPEPETSQTADQDTDEEPMEEAKIEEHEEEGDFLEDFPDDTDVPPLCHRLACQIMMMSCIGSRARPLSNWITGGPPVAAVC